MNSELAVSRRRRPVAVMDLHYTDVDRKASSSKSLGWLLFAQRTQTAAVIGFSSGVSKSLKSMEIRFFIQDCGRVAPSLSTAMGVCAASEQTEEPSEWLQVSDPRGLYPAVRRLPLFNSNTL